MPELVHFALLPGADRANEDLRHYCKDNKLNLIYEGTMRGTSVFLKIAKEFKAAGYEVDLALMSVPKLASYGSTLLRYATDLMNDDTGRWVPKNVHDEAYEKIIVTLRELEKNKLFDKAEVYRRGTMDENGIPQLIYPTKGREFTGPIEALTFGRDYYKKQAIIDYEEIYEVVRDTFEKKAPSLLHSLKDWEKLYETELKQQQSLDNSR